MKILFVLLTMSLIFFLGTLHAKETTSQHPTDVPFSKKIDLPLEDQKTLVCISCHGEHTSSKNETNAKIPNFLRKPYASLCETCHKEKYDKKSNHPTKSCSECHQMHFGKKKLTRGDGESLCVSCHKDFKVNHPSIATLEGTGKTKSVSVDNSKIICATCHFPHSVPEGGHYLRKDPAVSQFCANCHGEKATGLYSNFHKPRQMQ